MKKIVAIAAFLLIFSSLSYSQNSGELGPGLRLGFQASPTFSWLAGEVSTVNNNGTNLGIKLQIIGEAYFQPNYAFTVGFGFAFGQGGTLQFENEGKYWARSVSDADYPILDNGEPGFPAGVNLKYDIQYIEVPVGLKLRTREFGYFRYFVEPQLVLAFRSKAWGTAKGNPDFERINVKNDVNPFNASWGIGAGTEYGISESSSIVAGLFFHNSFIDVTSDKESDDTTKASLNTITIRLAVIF